MAGRWLKLAAGLAAYLLLYATLDWISLIDPASPLGITPLNPPAGLSFALLLRYGARVAPAVFAAVVAADVSFRHAFEFPVAAFGAALAITGLYTLAAELLRRRVRMDRDLAGRRDLVALLAVALAAAAAVAAAAIAIFCAGGLLDWSDYFEFALRFWVGDVLGIVILAPFLLLLAPPRRWVVLLRPGAAAEYGLQLAAIGLGLWIIFGLERLNHFEFSYVLFLPLIWIALRDGLAGAAWGIVATQIGLAVAIQAKGFDAAAVTQFQLLMLAVAVTGFFLGGVVDERRRAEGALRASEAQLQAVVSTAPDAILTFDDGGTIGSVNRAAAEMFGAGRSGLAGRPVEVLLPALDPRPGAGSGLETMARRLDGGAFAAEVGIGRADLAGRGVNVAVIRDITARKAAEAALREHETRLAHAARLTAAGEMAAGLAHELNQPLTAVVGFARAAEEVLKSAGAADPARLEAARRESVALIGQAAEQAVRAGEIVRRTRAFLRRSDKRLVAVAPAALFAAAQGLVRAEAEAAGVAIAATVAPGTPAVRADRLQIEQVLVNLLRNAIEEIAAARAARREIALAAAPAPDAPGMVEFAVADSGPGFAPAIAARLFEPFATTKSEGMGLGLSISRTIIEAHGGRIRAEAGAAGGAVLRFTLPIAAAAEEDDAD